MVVGWAIAATRALVVDATAHVAPPMAASAVPVIRWTMPVQERLLERPPHLLPRHVPGAILLNSQAAPQPGLAMPAMMPAAVCVDQEDTLLSRINRDGVARPVATSTFAVLV